MSQPLAILGFSPTIPSAASGRALVHPATDSAFPIQHFSFSFPNIGGVEYRSTTSEAIGQADQGKTIAFSSVSPCAVTLNTPTDGSFTCYVTVSGAGGATFTPASGTISYGTTTGAANYSMPSGGDGIIFWDGTDWQLLLMNGGGNATEIQGVPVSATGPTNGQVLTYNGSVWIPQTPGSSSGTAPFNSMLAPATITPPVLSGLTWGNQGTATAAYNAGGALALIEPGTPATEDIRFLYKSTPATPYTLTVGFTLTASAGNRSIAGIAIRDSGGGKIQFFFAGLNNSGSVFIGYGDWSSYTTFSADSVVAGFVMAPVQWLQFTDDGTNFNFSTASDGQNFVLLQQISRTNYVPSGGNQVGIAIGPLAHPMGSTFVHWAGI